MENLFPTGLQEYCSYFKIDFFELRLRCIFCKTYVDLIDLAKFHIKNLRLVYRDNVPHACCSKCLFHSARYEAEQHFQCCVRVADLHLLLNTDLPNVYMRCYYCLKLLDLQEKIDLIARLKKACLIRGYWRAPCRNCIDRDY